MKKYDYNKISIEHFAKQMHINIVTDNNNFIVSKGSDGLEAYSLNFDYPHIVEGIAILFCKNGRLGINLNLSNYIVSENSLLIIPPSSIIQVQEKSDIFKVELLYFTFDFISNMKLLPQMSHVAKRINDKSCIQLEKETFTEFLTIHKLIVNQYQLETVYREEIVKNFLYALLYKIIQLYPNISESDHDESKPRKEDIHMKFISLLFEYFKTERSVRFYAEKLFLTPKYFSKIIKEISGKSVADWIDEIVIMNAKALLKSSDMTVLQISDELNFANPSFFGTFFKKHVGLTPIQYRSL